MPWLSLIFSTMFVGCLFGIVCRFLGRLLEGVGCNNTTTLVVGTIEKRQVCDELCTSLVHRLRWDSNNAPPAVPSLSVEVRGYFMKNILD
jgi:hypothetical protein